MIKNLLLLLSISTLIGSCNSFSQKKLDPLVEADTHGLNISLALLEGIQNDLGKAPEKFERDVYIFHEDGSETKTPINSGVFFDFISERKAHSIFNKYREKVMTEGNYIFLTEMDFDDDFTDTYYDVVILEAADQFELIERLGTSGYNYDVYPKDVLAQMKQWHRIVDFEIIVVDGARIHAHMNKKHPNMRSFAQEVYEFCPDVIDQGYGDLDEMVSDLNQSGYFWMWWD